MTDQILPQVEDRILSHDQKTPEAIFPLLMRAVGKQLNCDRVFL